MTDVQTFFKEARQRLSRSAKAAAYAQARMEVYARSEGRCEAAVADVCTIQGTQAHHKRRRSQGGGDTPANLLWVCRACHDHIHRHPSESVDAGLLEFSSFDPAPGLVSVTKVNRT